MEGLSKRGRLQRMSPCFRQMREEGRIKGSSNLFGEAGYRNFNAEAVGKRPSAALPSSLVTAAYAKRYKVQGVRSMA
jgi:hypothetical protein